MFNVTNERPMVSVKIIAGYSIRQHSGIAYTVSTVRHLTTHRMTYLIV